MTKSEYQILATSADYRDVTEFWRRQLAAADDVIAVLRTGPAGGPQPRQAVGVTLSATALAALRKLSSDPLGRLTVVSAGIALAAARYFNRSHILIRTPLLPDEAPPALNPEREVALVFAVESDATLRDLLDAAAGMVEESYGFQDYPVGMLFEAERGVDLRHRAAFSLSSAVIHGAPLATLAPIHFNCDGIGDGTLTVEFDPVAVESFVAEGLAALVRSALECFADLSTPVRQVERVPEDQRDRLTVDWNRTDTPFPFRRVSTWFEEQVAAAPDALALQFGTDRFTYAELNALANRLAHVLIASGGAGTGPAIGIWMDRSPWMVVAVLGVLKAGLAYLPIDAECPKRRLTSILKDSGVARLLVDESKASAVDAPGCELVVADREPASTVVGNPATTVSASDLAYLIYTSGSTGEPKGCAIEHHTLSNYLQWAIGYYWNAPGAGSMGLFSPLSFDLTVTSLFCPLLRGCTLVVFPQHAPIADVLRQQFEPASPIDAIKLTPSHIRLLDPDRLQGTRIRLAIVGGEALTTQQVGILKRIDPRIRVINEYGPTEATVGCCVRDVAADEAVTIGRPIANTRMYVLDEEQRLVPIGGRGEICIAGGGLARGYHNRPALTAQRFIADPFVPGERLYRTGDVGRWLPGGELECFGRLDNQVKIRGYRIELGEIEAVLRRCVGIREAVVIARQDEDDAELIAYVESDDEMAASELRRTLAATLPEYMVPSAFVRLDALPLTANGKVDHARLPRYFSSSRLRPSYVAPATETQRTLAGIWQDVFRLEAIGLSEDFFELGGHSLRAMDVLRRIHQAFGVELSVGDVLSNPSIVALALVVESKQPSTIEPIAAVPPAEHYPLSHGQRSLWVINRIEEGTAAYNISSAYDVRGPLNPAALTAAFGALVARHASLRTVFIEIDGEPRQRILPEMPLTIDDVDLRAVPDRESRLRVLVERQASAAFDLAAGPLLRAAAFRMEESRSILALTLHHIVSDEWSMRILIKEAVQLYEGFRAGAGAGLAALPIQYADYAVWQRGSLASEAMQAHRMYWLTQLAGELPVLDLPADFQRPPVQSYRGRHHHLALDGAVVARLRALGSRHGASPFMTLVAIVKVLLYRYTGQHDIRVGAPIAGRTRAELEPQIGFFVNTLVLRDEIGGAETFGALLARVKQTAEAAYEHQAYPFDRLVEELELPRDPSRAPIFDVMVTYETASDAALSLGRLTVEEIPFESGVTKFDLTLAFAEAGAGLDLEIEYNTDLFAPDRIDRLGAHVRQLIESVLTSDTTPVGYLAIVSDEERRVLLESFNDTAADAGAGETIVSLFERQVAETPESTAIVFQDRRLTYRELNARANRLAHRLIAEHRVAAGDCVAVLMDRSEQLVVALLGILKSGAAYVPIDPDDPEARIAFIERETRAKTIVRNALAGDEHASVNPKRRAAPEDLAYVLYTSGSTGQPKGVMVEHRSVVNVLQFLRREVIGPSGKSQAACASYTFDVSVQELFSNLVHGNTVHLIDADVRRDPERLLDYVAAHRIDMVDCTPSFFSALLDAGLAERRDLHVQDWFAGAEVLAPELLHRYYANPAHRRVRFNNFYGPTEGTINATRWSTDGDRVAAFATISIGTPIANGRIYILDEQRQPVPIGVPGEMCIAGAGVARGYLNQPEQTARVFVDDPFRPGERMYRTGDRGRWRADGALEFIGRLDDQVKIRGYRIEPAEVEYALRLHPSIREAAVVPVPDGAGRKLAAFFVCDDPSAADETALREFLAHTIASYMIPAEFARLDALPLNASGKVDRRRLVNDHASASPAPPTSAIAGDARTDRERLLLDVLASVLGRTGIGVHDNFFYVGGDSIKAIQVVNRLGRQGWTLRVRDLFEAPRIDQLALRLERSADAARSQPVSGDVPLTPMQRWFFDTQQETLAHYNQSVMLRFAGGLDAESLRQVGRAIVRQHAALRLRYRVEAGAAVQFHGEPYDPVDVRDLRTAADPVAELERQAAGVQASLDLQRGPLARLVLFRLPDADRLLVVIHHLAVDGVSWRILLEDLRLGLGQIAEGRTVDLGIASDSFQAWSSALEQLRTLADSERDWWQAVSSAPVVRLPFDAAGGRALESGSREQRIALSAADTGALLTQVHHAYNTRVNDVLLAALARALREWAGDGAFRVDLETHGRAGVDGVDVSRTVGWFTALYPVVLDLDDARDAGDQIKLVKESLRRTPGHGLGYGLLHGAAVSSSPILFNFLGQFDTDVDGVEIAEEDRGPEHGPLAATSHDLEIGGWISQGRAHLTVKYSPLRFRDATITRFLGAFQSALETLIAHCRDRAKPERTASDYRYRDATTPALIARLGADRVEDVYPLSPMQEGMLFHGVLAPESPVYFEQFASAITGSLDEARLQRAWQAVIARHAALRTAFFWNDVEQPVQVVFSHVDAPWTSYDWRDLSDSDRAARLDAFPWTDRRLGVRLDQPPLMRFTLIRTGDQAYTFYWSSHHLLLDGWSAAILLQEAFAFYQAEADGVSFTPAPARPFGEYIDWLRSRDASSSIAYWRERLAGFATPTPLPYDNHRDPLPEPFARAELSLSADASARLAAAAREHLLTLNTIARGVWALLLAIHSRRDEVVFGATVSGRPASLPGVETMVGLFINTLPVRVRIDPSATFADWLRALQADHLDLDQHAYGSLADIQRLSEVPRRTALFDSILVFENYPVDPSIDPSQSDLSIEIADVLEQTNYPLTMSIVPGDRMLLRLSHDTSRMDEESGRSIVREVAALLEAFVAAPAQPLAAMLASSHHTERALISGTLDRETLPPPDEFPSTHHVAPRDPVERRVARVWERVLRTSPIGVTDDFFDLGGHSILAVKLVSALQSEFGRALPLAQLLANPTIERLAIALQSDTDLEDWRPLVEIRSGGPEPPLFLLPGAGGNVIYFQALARHLSPSRPIYGLQAVGLDGHTPPLTTVEAIAAANIAEMRRVQPSGPYFFAGHSFGGGVALEMAQQLHRQGQAVGLLAVLDTAAPLFEPLVLGRGWQDAHWLAKIAREIEEFFDIHLDVAVDELLPLPLEDQLMRVVARMQLAGAWAADADADQLRGYLQVYKANSQAAHVQYADAAGSPIALFKALDPDPDIDETPAGLIDLMQRDAWGWETFALGPVNVFAVPGAHLSMLAEPHVQTLARAIDQALQSAAAAPRPAAAGGPA